MGEDIVVEAVEVELFNARVTVVLVKPRFDQPQLQGVVRQDGIGVRPMVHLSRGRSTIHDVEDVDLDVDGPGVVVVVVVVGDDLLDLDRR
eukprot:14400987-Heterocapsa_arctica.AAC.1